MKYTVMILTLVLGLLVPNMATASMAGGELKVQEYTYDFAVDGGAVGFIDLADKYKLPAGAIILRVHTHVKTALASSGSATVSVGDSTSNARYLAATAFNDAAFDDEVPKALSTALPNKVDAANEGKVGIAIGTAALTAGKMKLILEVYMPKGE